MRIQRSNSRLTFRQRRRRSGCLPLAVVVSLLVGVPLLAWSWLEGWFTTLAPALPASDPVESGEAAFARGDLDNAIAFARAALDANPGRVDALVLIARALIYRSYSDYDRDGDRESALELLSEAMLRNPGDLDLRAAYAFVLQANRQPAAAAEAARYVLEKQPSHVLARVALALAYAVAGSSEIALRESQQAVRAAPGMLDAQRALAITSGDAGRYENAIRAIESAITINNRLATLYFERALYALQIGDTDGATFAYMQVLAIEPDNVKARLRLCELSSLLREREAAAEYCTQVTQLAPSFADGWYQLGREYFLQGDYAAAQASLNRCSRLQVMQNVPVSERRLECWYLQGQAAEIRNDCPALLATYNEFRAMTLDADIQQTWVYPPEGPPGCGK
jgi:tetratricopeptide (TPR) repeat protein